MATITTLAISTTTHLQASATITYHPSPGLNQNGKIAVGVGLGLGGLLVIFICICWFLRRPQPAGTPAGQDALYPDVQQQPVAPYPPIQGYCSYEQSVVFPEYCYRVPIPYGRRSLDGEVTEEASRLPDM